MSSPKDWTIVSRQDQQPSLVPVQVTGFRGVLKGTGHCRPAGSAAYPGPSTGRWLPKGFVFGFRVFGTHRALACVSRQGQQRTLVPVQVDGFGGVHKVQLHDLLGEVGARSDHNNPVVGCAAPDGPHHCDVEVVAPLAPHPLAGELRGHLGTHRADTGSQPGASCLRHQSWDFHAHPSYPERGRTSLGIVENWRHAGYGSTTLYKHITDSSVPRHDRRTCGVCRPNAPCSSVAGRGDGAWSSPQAPDRPSLQYSSSPLRALY